jgi:hypothetical protein
MTDQSADRRGETRRSVDLPNGIEIRVPTTDGRTRAIMAQLVDASNSGIGVETFIRLERGTTVLVQADLTASGMALAFGGKARVAHTREVSPGRYHVGLELKNVRYARAS